MYYYGATVVFFIGLPLRLYVKQNIAAVKVFKSECAALRLEDINWKENILIVDQTLEFQPEGDDKLLMIQKHMLPRAK